MFSVGLELTVDDFKRVVVQPKDFIIGAISQIILLPLAAFLLLSVWDIQPALAVGVMIIAACPGGVTSNLLTYLARGDTALSVSLTAIISLLAVLTLPFIVGFSIHYFMDVATAPELSVGKTIIGVFLITTVPVVIGMIVKKYAPVFAARFERVARVIASILFVVIIIGAVVGERENIIEYFKQAGPVTLTLNIVMMFYGGSPGTFWRVGTHSKNCDYIRMRAAKWNFGDLCGSDTDWKYGHDGAGWYLQPSHVRNSHTVSPLAETASHGTGVSS